MRVQRSQNTVTSIEYHLPRKVLKELYQLIWDTRFVEKYLADVQLLWAEFGIGETAQDIDYHAQNALPLMLSKPETHLPSDK